MIIATAGHVDHGKTTLSDSLVSSNGLISSKLVGKVRFLDSNEEEQKRGITMHASAISLGFTLTTPHQQMQQAVPQEYLINLVDSPGHIDFSCDVSTATRLCDGALIVVDVVEGACTQTHAVVHKALKEGLWPCLVLNKIDRLVLELRLSPIDAFYQLRRVIENINALASTLVKSAVAMAVSSGQPVDREALEELWTFSPPKGNVVFASAYDCWGFSIQKFAAIWSKKLGLSRQILQKHMFDDFCLNPMTKKLTRYDPLSSSSAVAGDAPKPMFASLVLDPIWTLYETAVVEQDASKAAKMAARALGVQIEAREVSSREPRSTVQAIFRSWLPLADAVLRAVVKHLPSPCASQASSGRISGLLPSVFGDVKSHSAFPPATLQIMENIKACDATEESPVVVFVSKLVGIRAAELSRDDQRRLEQWRACSSSNDAPRTSGGEVDETLGFSGIPETSLAIARVFCGTLKPGCRLLVLNARHKPVEEMAIAWAESTVPVPSPESGVDVMVLEDPSLYLCLGPSVYPIASAVAGNIVGIWTPTLGDAVLKTATLSSSLAAPLLEPMTFQAKPMVRVAIEPVSHVHLARVNEGLRRLHRFDAAVEIGTDALGQRTIACLGELHLEQCVKLLVERFAGCEVLVSEPIVSLRETLVAPEEGGVDEGLEALQHFWRMKLPCAAATYKQVSAPRAGKPCTLVASSGALPPPWGDVVRDSDASSGLVRVVSNDTTAAITLRAVPLPRWVRSVFSMDTIADEDDEDDVAEGQIGVTISLGEAEQEERRIQKMQTVARLRSSLGNRHGGAALALDASALQACAAFASGLHRGSYAGKCSIASPEIDSATLDSDEILGDVMERLVTVSEDGSNVLMLSGRVDCLVWNDRVPLSRQHTENRETMDGGDEGNSAGDPGMLLTPTDTISLQQKNSLSGDDRDGGGDETGTTRDADFRQLWPVMQSAVMAAFDSVCQAGPLMGEPLQHVAVVVERIELCEEQVMAVVRRGSGVQGRGEFTTRQQNANGAGLRLNTGQFISEVAGGLRGALLTARLHVVEPVYRCGLQCDAAKLGDLYSVLARRRGSVVDEDVVEGTSLFVIQSFLPVLESFGFAQELLKKTSGAGTTPQLRFSHWNCIREDPFWVPTTDEERDEHGEVGSFNALSKDASWTRGLVTRVRRRKGLPVEEKVVVSAEKQRNLKR